MGKMERRWLLTMGEAATEVAANAMVRAAALMRANIFSREMRLGKEAWGGGWLG
jgi:truncated hemoglobin YjbI